MENWPQPTTVKKLRGFLGLTGYHRRFIKSYGTISRPLTDMLKKKSFIWSSDAVQAFNALKQAMLSAPVLALPDFSLPFVLETDACSKGIGALLMQHGKPIAFYSKGLGPKALALSTYEKELMAIVMAVQKWKYYLSHCQFIINTDHQSLRFLMEQRVTSVLQHKWLMKLLGLDYVIRYKKGLHNKAADALSRIPHSNADCLAISLSQPQWAQDIILRYAEDPVAQQLIAQLLVQPSHEVFSYNVGILRYKDRLYIGSGHQVRDHILQYVHCATIGGHSGMLGTYNRAKAHFYWPKMKAAILQFVANCEVFQCNKGEHTHSAGLLQPLPIPESAWKHIAMDFIEGLPLSNRISVILVVVDRLTKYSHFIALAHPFTSLTVAKEFLHHVFKLHGLPASIVSDRDKIFISQFWQELFKALGTSLHLSTSYHPQTDGQTERTNACLEQYLCCMTDDQEYLHDMDHMLQML